MRRPTVWRTWWLGDSSGALIVVPLALAWYRPLRSALAAAAVGRKPLSCSSERSSRWPSSRSSEHRPLTYLVFPAVDLGRTSLRPARRDARRRGHRASSTVWNTIHYLGAVPFRIGHRAASSAPSSSSPSQRCPTLCLAAVVSEREQFAARLGASRSRLVSAADNARRRLEQDLHDGAQLRLTWLAVQLRDAAAIARSRIQSEPRRFSRRPKASCELAIDELRELAHGIHPAVLVDLGLAEAIKSLALAFDHSGQAWSSCPDSRLDEPAETVGYYVVAEAIANAQKYSQRLIDPGARYRRGKDKPPHRGRRRRGRRRGRAPGLRPGGPARPCRGDRRNDGAEEPHWRRYPHNGHDPAPRRLPQRDQVAQVAASSPCRARATASMREWAPSAWSRWRMWLRTVSMLRWSSRAIW